MLADSDIPKYMLRGSQCDTCRTDCVSKINIPAVHFVKITNGVNDKN